MDKTRTAAAIMTRTPIAACVVLWSRPRIRALVRDLRKSAGRQITTQAGDLCLFGGNMAQCIVFLSMEKTPDIPAHAVLDALDQLPSQLRPIAKAGDPRYDPDTHTVIFDANVRIVKHLEITERSHT